VRGGAQCRGGAVPGGEVDEVGVGADTVERLGLVLVGIAAGADLRAACGRLMGRIGVREFSFGHAGVAGIPVTFIIIVLLVPI